ncbi:DUF6491 family protein [Dokdonella sp.]|uniref:DUF6491 family protein n=1 Tax=Dokdonella sp. TaxID=2291710 RepID=UPI0031C18A41|nr:DUF6491 family protein [Dokdonella sp.]
MKILSLLVLTLLLSACVPAMTESAVRPAAHSQANASVDYREYTTSPVMAADFSNIQDWSSPDPEHVVLWSTPNRAYLVSLMGACLQLQDAPTIGISGGAGGSFVRAGRDAILVQGERCPIRRIDRLDTRRLKAALAAAGQPVHE